MTPEITLLRESCCRSTRWQCIRLRSAPVPIGVEPETMNARPRQISNPCSSCGQAESSHSKPPVLHRQTYATCFWTSSGKGTEFSYETISGQPGSRTGQFPDHFNDTGNSGGWAGESWATRA